MPVINTQERIAQVVRRTLEEAVTSPDDVWEFSVHINSLPAHDVADDTDESDVCDECGGCPMVSVAVVYMALACPETDSHAASHWYTPVAQTYDEEAFVAAVEETISNLVFRRQMYALDEGVTAPARGDSSPPSPGTD